MLRNSTNIPSALIVAALKHAMPPDTTVPEIVEVKNKKNGKWGGQHGWYYPGEKRVVIIVPREISREYTYRMKFTKHPITYNSRAEFLVAVMAHEVKHHHQWEKWKTPESQWRLHGNRLGKLAREVDAEQWQLAKLKSWRLIFTE